VLQRRERATVGVDLAGVDLAGVDLAGVDPAGVDPVGVDPAAGAHRVSLRELDGSSSEPITAIAPE
jgi:hypothetical protein